MCGIGLLFSPHKNTPTRNSISEKMAQSILHRGPDGGGIWTNEEQNISIFHRLLAILDSTSTGNQPMVSPSKNWTISFNGEIYNYTHLRKELVAAGGQFSGHSDTEVIAHLVDHHGPIETVKKLRGMFAIIFYQTHKKELYITRDRIGEKPLYYGKIGSDLVVASEPKAFFQHPDFKPTINANALSAYVKYGYIPQPLSIYEGIKKVPPATILKIDLKNSHPETEITYWTPPTHQQKTENQNLNFEQTCDTLHKKLRETIALQFVSGVPTGCFLSGGIDSSLIAGLMQSQSATPIHTYTIGFDNPDYNEAPYARAVARQLGTSHTEWILTAADALSIVSKLANFYDEPFADSSQIPTLFLSQLARQKITVALSGDGGDELFAGYNRYAWSEKLWRTLDKMPQFSKQLIGASPTSILKLGLDVAKFISPQAQKLGNFSGRIDKLRRMIPADSPANLYDRVLSLFNNPDSILKNSESYSFIEDQDISASELVGYMLKHDLTHYLPDDIMVKVDRASMAASLEMRSPFLDHELIESVYTLPPQFVHDTKNPKFILKKILGDYFPTTQFERPKSGFAAPINEWLRNELKSLAMDLLAPDTIQKQGLFQEAAVQKLLQTHMSGKQNLGDQIWTLLSFQLWYNKWMGS